MCCLRNSVFAVFHSTFKGSLTTYKAVLPAFLSLKLELQPLCTGLGPSPSARFYIVLSSWGHFLPLAPLPNFCCSTPILSPLYNSGNHRSRLEHCFLLLPLNSLLVLMKIRFALTPPGPINKCCEGIDYSLIVFCS